MTISGLIVAIMLSAAIVGQLNIHQSLRNSKVDCNLYCDSLLDIYSLKPQAFQQFAVNLSKLSVEFDNLVFEGADVLVFNHDYVNDHERDPLSIAVPQHSSLKAGTYLLPKLMERFNQYTLLQSLPDDFVFDGLVEQIDADFVLTPLSDFNTLQLKVDKQMIYNKYLPQEYSKKQKRQLQKDFIVLQYTENETFSMDYYPVWARDLSIAGWVTFTLFLVLFIVVAACSCKQEGCYDCEHCLDEFEGCDCC